MCQVCMPSIVRQQFKKAMARKGLDGVRPMLDAQTVASLSYTQVVRLLRALDNALDERKMAYREAMGVAGRQAEAAQADRAVKEMQALIRTVNAGVMVNPDIRKGQNAQLEDVILDAHGDRARIWRKPQKNARLHRANLERRIHDAFECLADKYPDFFRVHAALCEASDALLEKTQGRPLGGFWHQRLKFSLFAPVKPLSQRIQVFPGVEACAGTEDGDVDENLLRFHGDVVDALARQPDFIYRFLDEMGYDIRLGERLRDIDHDYLQENLTCGRESFEAFAAGVHHVKTLEMDLPIYKCVQEDGRWEMSLAHDRGAELELVIGHEAFHGIDRQLGYPSQSDAGYTQAYKKDCETMRSQGLTKDERDLVAYYLTCDMGGKRKTVAGGRSESFAETAAEVALGWQDDVITPHFKNCAGWVAKTAYSLRLVYALCPDGFATLTPDALAHFSARENLLPRQVSAIPALRAV